MIDVEVVLISAESCDAREDKLLAKYFVLFVGALQELWYRVYRSQKIKKSDRNERSLACAIFTSEIGMTHIEIAVGRECQCDPDGQSLR